VWLKYIKFALLLALFDRFVPKFPVDRKKKFLCNIFDVLIIEFRLLTGLTIAWKISTA